MRQIVLDTETTGLRHEDGHRIIEIGCVELINRQFTGKVYHQYINPQREVDAGAYAVHGIADDFLADKPLFQQIVKEFLTFIKGAELVIHNAPFDVGFLNAELALLGGPLQTVEMHSEVTDSLMLARRQHPGQRNSLDALCQRYHVDRSHREYHGALLDAELLAKVYLLMTGGQGSLFGGDAASMGRVAQGKVSVHDLQSSRDGLVSEVSEEELSAHKVWLETLKASAGHHYFEFSDSAEQN